MIYSLSIRIIDRQGTTFNSILRSALLNLYLKSSLQTITTSTAKSLWHHLKSHSLSKASRLHLITGQKSHLVILLQSGFFSQTQRLIFASIGVIKEPEIARVNFAFVSFMLSLVRILHHPLNMVLLPMKMN